MKRFYNFFLLLYFVSFLLSFVFSTLVSLGISAFIRFNETPELILAGDIPFLASIKTGLWHGLIFSAVLFASLVFLFRLAFRLQKKFTPGMIIGVMTWFFTLTLIIFLILFAWFILNKSYIGLYLLSGHIFSIPSPAWWPFPLVWIALFIFYAEKIKNNPDYGS